MQVISIYIKFADFPQCGICKWKSEAPSNAAEFLRDVWASINDMTTFGTLPRQVVQDLTRPEITFRNVRVTDDNVTQVCGASSMHEPFVVRNIIKNVFVSSLG